MGATVWEMLDPIPIHIAHERVRAGIEDVAAPYGADEVIVVDNTTGEPEVENLAAKAGARVPLVPAIGL